MKIQEFRYVVYGDPKLLGELLFLAFKELDGYSDEFPIDIAGRAPRWGKRTIRVFPLNKRGFEDIDELFPIDALKECNVFNLEISYSYWKKGKRGYVTKDVYRVELFYKKSRHVLVITFIRLRGLGRTFPRFLAFLIQKKITEISYMKKRYRNIFIKEIPMSY